MNFFKQLALGALLTAVLSVWQPSSAASAKDSPGKEIFRQHCAKCHGRNGEGMKGKYEDPLQDDRSLDKLTRYIERNMPDDKPGTIVGEKAAAVAKYIYGAFYSREARGEKPPRIELARLTNRQYLNSVADLLKEFTGKDGYPTDEHGLRATYYDSKYFNSDKKTLERLDRVVAFDFAENKPDGTPSGTNAFSIQWRGSVKAEETGDYEFILKTPNGARLWVNDEDEPLIDAWVASGKLSEHPGKIRLIGGRLYPIKLEFFKAAEKTAAISLLWNPPHGAQQPLPARNLSPIHSSPTFVITTPFPPDDSSLGYERGVSISKAWDEATTSGAIETAKYVADHLDALSGSKAGDTNRLEKIQQFCARFVSAAFHRPLLAEEKQLYVAGQLKPKVQSPKSKVEGPKPKVPPKEPGHQDTSARRAATSANHKSEVPVASSADVSRKELEDAVRRVVLLTLKSPRFLYRGLDQAKPDDYEIAARLSYGLWDSIPDEHVRQLAQKHELHTAAQVQEAARRMLDHLGARFKMLGFFHHWLQVDRIENLSKDSKLFPGFTPDVVADLRTSLNLFLDDTMWSDASDYRNLLMADYIFFNDRLAGFYGVHTNGQPKPDKAAHVSKESGSDDVAEIGPAEGAKTNDDFLKVTFGGEERCGVLTHPYLLASFSYQKLTSPIHRGVFLTRHIVGRALKPPPMAMTFKDADFAPNLTMRQKVSELTRPQACQSCHSVINPLGFSLEQFDAVGRFRTSENQKPIDPVSEYISDDGEKVRLAGAHDVAQFAIGSEAAHNAFIQEMFHHVVKQPMEAYGPNTLSRLRESFAKSGFNMKQLVIEIATIAAVQSAPAQ